jgi:hypothetical protein
LPKLFAHPLITLSWHLKNEDRHQVEDEEAPEQEFGEKLQVELRKINR